MCVLGLVPRIKVANIPVHEWLFSSLPWIISWRGALFTIQRGGVYAHQRIVVYEKMTLVTQMIMEKVW